MREGVLKGSDVDIHIALADCLALDTAKVYSLFLGVFTDDLHDREPVGRDQVRVSRVPDSAGSRGGVVQIHTHALLLRAMASKSVVGG